MVTYLYVNKINETDEKMSHAPTEIAGFTFPSPLIQTKFPLLTTFHAEFSNSKQKMSKDPDNFENKFKI